jgi:hypothetical protein
VADVYQYVALAVEAMSKLITDELGKEVYSPAYQSFFSGMQPEGNYYGR